MANQSNSLECDECGVEGELGMGYGRQSAVECPNCGDKWVSEAPLPDNVYLA